MPVAALSEAECLVLAPRATWVSTWMWSTAVESYLPRTQIGFVLVEDKVATPVGSPLPHWSHATILVTGDAGVLGPREGCWASSRADAPALLQGEHALLRAFDKQRFSHADRP